MILFRKIMKRFFKRQNHYENDDLPVVAGNTSRIHAIDYDAIQNLWIVRFVHITTSAYRDSIQRTGIVAPNLEQVLDVLFNRYPEYAHERLEFSQYIQNAPLGPVRRVEETFDGRPVIYSTYLLNESGANVLFGDGQVLALHGGEVYSRSIQLLREFFSIEDGRFFDGLYMNFEPDYYIIEYKFEDNFDENIPITLGRKIKEIVENINRADMRKNLSDILEVQFLVPATWMDIVFVGSKSQFVDSVDFRKMFSGAALSRIREIDSQCYQDLGPADL